MASSELLPAKDVRALDSAHHLHPFTDHKTLAGEGGSRVIRRAEGVYLWDADGQRILDGMAGLWCVNAGYGRRELADAAYRQLLELPYYNCFFKTTNAPAAALACRLSEITPDGLTHVFYAGSGSEANDTIVRMVRHFWNLHGRPTKKTFISRQWAYHGSTMAAASLGGMAAMHGQADLPLPGFVHVPPPYWYDLGNDLEPQAFGRLAARWVEDKILELGPDTVAAFVGEPVQGAGGVIIPPESYWPEVERICRKYDVLLVVDEVVCGFGRLGRWFGSQYYGITPDLAAMAKGLTSGYVPMAAVMVGERIARTLIDEGGEFFHGFTYSGHPTACAVALANLELIEREGLVERVATDTGPYLQQCLRQALGDHPLVGEVRGIGLVAGIELVADRATRSLFRERGKVGTLCRDHCFRNNLIMRAVRDTMVTAPPLVISHAEIDELVTLARQAIDLTARDLGRL